MYTIAPHVRTKQLHFGHPSKTSNDEFAARVIGIYEKNQACLTSEALHFALETLNPIGARVLLFHSETLSRNTPKLYNVKTARYDEPFRSSQGPPMHITADHFPLRCPKSDAPFSIVMMPIHNGAVKPPHWSLAVCYCSENPGRVYHYDTLTPCNNEYTRETFLRYNTPNTLGNDFPGIFGGHYFELKEVLSREDRQDSEWQCGYGILAIAKMIIDNAMDGRFHHVDWDSNFTRLYQNGFEMFEFLALAKYMRDNPGPVPRDTMYLLERACPTIETVVFSKSEAELGGTPAADLCIYADDTPMGFVYVPRYGILYRYGSAQALTERAPPSFSCKTIDTHTQYGMYQILSILRLAASTVRPPTDSYLRSLEHRMSSMTELTLWRMFEADKVDRGRIDIAHYHCDAGYITVNRSNGLVSKIRYDCHDRRSWRISLASYLGDTDFSAEEFRDAVELRRINACPEPLFHASEELLSRLEATGLGRFCLTYPISFPPTRKVADWASAYSKGREAWANRCRQLYGMITGAALRNPERRKLVVEAVLNTPHAIMGKKKPDPGDPAFYWLKKDRDATDEFLRSFREACLPAPRSDRRRSGTILLYPILIGARCGSTTLGERDVFSFREIERLASVLGPEHWISRTNYVYLPYLRLGTLIIPKYLPTDKWVPLHTGVVLYFYSILGIAGRERTPETYDSWIGAHPLMPKDIKVSGLVDNMNELAGVKDKNKNTTKRRRK